MPAVPLADAMIVWTPNTELWQNTPQAAPAGSIAIFRGPDDQGAFRRYPCSRGNCDLDWREGDDEYRLQQLANLVAQWREKDCMNPKHVAEALRIIEGIERLRDYEGHWPPHHDEESDDG